MEKVTKYDFNVSCESYNIKKCNVQENFKMLKTENESCRFNVEIRIENKNIIMFQIDSGSAISAFSKLMYNQCFKSNKLFDHNTILKAYNESLFKAIGYILLNVEYKHKSNDVKFFCRR